MAFDKRTSSHQPNPSIERVPIGDNFEWILSNSNIFVHELGPPDGPCACCGKQDRLQRLQIHVDKASSIDDTEVKLEEYKEAALRFGLVSVFASLDIQ
jgi:hypothetical protein